MSESIELAAGKINGDDLTIELITLAHGKPAKVTIHWPAHATVCTPASLSAVIALATRVLSNAVLELARLQNGNQ
jgi:hypothetical protein